MKLTIQTFGLLLFLTPVQIAFGQNNQGKALVKGQQAMQLEDEGKMYEAIPLLEEAQKLDPNNFNYPYELAYRRSVGNDLRRNIYEPGTQYKTDF